MSGRGFSASDAFAPARIRAPKSASLPAPPLVEHPPVLLDVSLECRVPDSRKVHDIKEIRRGEIVEGLSEVRRAVVRVRASDS